jgi:hypothetical protein
LDPNKVGGGVSPGWDTKMCQTVAQQANDWGAEADQRAANGDFEGAAVAAKISTSLENQVNNNCIVMD